MIYPDYVVVDVQDGAVFGKDQYNRPWDLGMAVDFMERRNSELKVPTYKLYKLTEMTADDLISAAEQQQESRYGGDGHFAGNH